MTSQSTVDIEALEFLRGHARILERRLGELWLGNGAAVVHVCARRALFPDAAIEAHLATLEGGQRPDGGWTVPWQPPGPASELAWRGVVTVHAARVLAAYRDQPAGSSAPLRLVTR